MNKSDDGFSVGVSGHQHRDGIDWSWVAKAVRRELASLTMVSKALSSLAAGSDQIFASTAIDLNIPVVAVLPLDSYEQYFHGVSLTEYRRLLGRCDRVQLGWKGSPERAFLEAGKYIVENSNILFLVWDGMPTDGLGGTADIAQYAAIKGCPVIHIDPISQNVRRGIRK